jgi:hypothetical protein
LNITFKAYLVYAMSKDSRLHSFFVSGRKALFRHASRKNNEASGTPAVMSTNSSSSPSPSSPTKESRPVPQAVSCSGPPLDAKTGSRDDKELANTLSVDSEDNEDCVVCLHSSGSIFVLRYSFQASITNLMIDSLPDGRDINNISLADAMNIASRERTTQYARKFGMLHEISEWEVRLGGAKDKVHECEEALWKLRQEVETTDGQLGKIESSMEELKRAMEAQYKLVDSTSDIDDYRMSESIK